MTRRTALIGPTGEGKTTFAAGLLSLRKWVLALDPKGEDETLTASGYERVRTLPSVNRGPWWRLRHWEAARQWDRIENRIAEGLPARIIVGGAARTEEQDAANQSLMRKCFAYAREAGGWTVYVDEFELISSQRMFRLGPQVPQEPQNPRVCPTSSHHWLMALCGRRSRRRRGLRAGSRAGPRP